MMKSVSRRNFGIGLSSLGLGLAATKAAFANAQHPGIDLSFPNDFVWGCASASYQIEGAAKEDGRGLTNWDVFSHTQGRVANGDNGDVACDSYHRYAEDAALLKNIGAKAYRLSIAWSRIFPEGRGQPNQKGVDHYKKVLDNLLENGITPYVTLFHWDLPQALPNGWQNRDTAYAFADYAGFMANALGDRVSHYMTTNEIRCFTDLGHQIGIHAPGLKLDAASVNQVRHHGVLAHGLGVQALRSVVKSDTQIGLAENAVFYVPAIETQANIEAAKKATRAENAMFLTAVMEGKYLDSYLESQGANAPKVKDGDMMVIGSPLDFVALNVYRPEYVRADGSKKGYAILPHHDSSPRMASPWLIVGPEVLYWAIRNTSELWGPKTIYISENGCSADDPMVDGHVDDVERVMYLRNYITAMQRAAKEKYPVKGYFLWSLIDNFEWADGFSKRFGIHHVDFKTQVRTPKLSAYWYKELIAKNQVV